MEEYKEEIKELILNSSTLYKYIDFKGGCELLNNSTILFRNPSFFNDPYDCYSGLISFDNIPKDFGKNLINKHYKNLDRKKRRKLIRDFEENAKPKMTDIFVDDFLVKEKNRKGIACFTRDFKNLLMWSQYAESHKGICIGFNLEKLYRSLKSQNLLEIVLLKVKYIKKFETRSYFKQPKDSIFHWLRSKSCSWEYEDEIRIVYSSEQFENTETVIIPFHKNVIDKVYLGSKIDDINELKVREIISNLYPMASIYKMSLSKNSFELKTDEK